MTADRAADGTPSAPATQADGLVAPDGMRLISDAEWMTERHHWLTAIRRDRTLTASAKLAAHAMALGRLGNKRQARCFGTLPEIADEIGASKDTAKRAVRDLLEAGWIVRKSGKGRGRANAYAFLIRARIVPLKGGTDAPRKGGADAPTSGSEKGARMHLGRGRDAPFSHIVYNPDLSQEGAERKNPHLSPSKNPIVVQDAERAVAKWRGGDRRAFHGLREWVLNHIIAADLLAPDELSAAGLSERGGKS